MIKYIFIICVIELYKIFLYFDKINIIKIFLMKVYVLLINKYFILILFLEFKRKYFFFRENISFRNLYVVLGLYFKKYIYL